MHLLPGLRRLVPSLLVVLAVLAAGGISPGVARAQTPTLSIVTAALPAGETSVPYSQSLTATGGTTPYTWSIAGGSLPAGLTLNPSTGVIAGTPSAASTATVTVQVTDAASVTASRGLVLTVVAAVAVSTVTLPDGAPGVAYSATLQASGGIAPYSWTIVSGALPAGLSLNAGTGAIVGVPTTAGVSSFTVRVADGAGGQAAAARTITIVSAPVITTTSLPGGQVGVAYVQTLTASGGAAPYTWSISAGALPPGLSLQPTTGVISGVPTATGTSTFAVMVSDSAGRTASRGFSIVIGTLAVTTTALPDGQVGVAYSQVLAATGGATPYSWSIATGTLPAGLSLNAASGVIAGVPTALGGSAFTVRVTDATGATATRALSITIGSLVVTTTSLPGGQVGVAYSQALSAAGGATPYTWSLASGALPAGLTLNATSGVIAGVPTATGTAAFTVRVTDAVGRTATRSLSIAIGTFQVVTTSLPDARIGVAYSATLQAAGGTAPYTWVVTGGALPAGLSLNPATGVIAGVPAVEGAFSFTVTVSDAAGRTATRTLSIAVRQVVIQTATLAVGRVGSPYSQALLAVGGTTPYTWSIVSGALPAGLALNASTGVIAGTPTVAGTSSFVALVMDAAGRTATRALSIQVRSVDATPLRITTSRLDDARVGVPYEETLVARGGTPPYRWSAMLRLPDGLTLNETTGVISGTPTHAGRAYVLIAVTDQQGAWAYRLLSLKVKEGRGTSLDALVQIACERGRHPALPALCRLYQGGSLPAHAETAIGRIIVRLAGVDEGDLDRRDNGRHLGHYKNGKRVVWDIDFDDDDDDDDDDD